MDNNINNLYLILTEDELLTPNTNFIYYCIWYRFTIKSHTFNISRALENKSAYVVHEQVNRFNKNEIEKYCGEILWNTLCGHLNIYKDITTEEKDGHFLLVIPMPIVDYVMQTIMKSGLKPQAWSGYFREWCYYWLSCNAAKGRARVSQSGGAEKIRVTKKIFNQVTLNLMKMGLIERCGKFRFGMEYSYGYAYKIPETVLKLSQNNWNLE